MNFNEEYLKLPEIYTRSGKKCYLDPIRNKLIFVTPEETIRQRVIQFLIENKFPAKMISVEEKLSHYGVESNRRADIIVNAYDKEQELYVPVMVIECKAPNVELDYKSCNQVFDYADILNLNFVVVTNGVYSNYYHYNAPKDTYEMIEDFPSYSDLLEDKYVVIPAGNMPPRVPLKKLHTYISDYHYAIGENTPKDLQICMVNFLECLLDKNYILPKGKYRLFNLINDLGVRFSSYGDASGGGATGLYRAFLIEYNNSTEIISIGVNTYCTWAKQDILKTAINVAIDNEKNSHHSIQLVVDDNCAFSENRIHFYHHGKIAVGNIGSGKLDELREYVRKYYPEIISDNIYYLGSLCNDHLWRLNEQDVMCLIENLISYALIRDEYRKYKKSQRTSKK